MLFKMLNYFCTVRTILSSDYIIVPRYENQSFQDACQMYGAECASICNPQEQSYIMNVLNYSYAESAGFCNYYNNYGQFVIKRDNMVYRFDPACMNTCNVVCKKRSLFPVHNAPVINIPAEPSQSQGNPLSAALTGSLLASSCLRNQTGCDFSRGLIDLLCPPCTTTVTTTTTPP